MDTLQTIIKSVTLKQNPKRKSNRNLYAIYQTLPMTLIEL